MRKRRVVLALALVAAIIGAAVMIANRFNDSGSSASSTSSTSTSTTTVPSAPADGTGSEILPGETVGPGKDQGDPQVAVHAAATALNNIWAASFASDADIKATIEQTVVPERRSNLEQVMIGGKPGLAALLGYQSPEEALLGAQQRVATQMYRVDQFDDGATATIRLFVLNEWIQPGIENNKSYQAPRIRVVRMRWQNDRWLLVFDADPPANERPTPQQNLQLDEAMRQFGPYLKGFKAYVDTG